MEFLFLICLKLCSEAIQMPNHRKKEKTEENIEKTHLPKRFARLLLNYWLLTLISINQNMINWNAENWCNSLCTIQNLDDLK